VSSATASQADLALATALVSGGDDRLAINPATGMNNYGCTPFPRPTEISMSSTTASIISAPAFDAAASALASLKLEGTGAHARYAEAMDSVRASLKRSFGWTNEEVVLSPSGTDSEVLLLNLAQALLPRPLSSILVSSDETGSGVSLAASGHHFSNTTSSGRNVRKGDPIGGSIALIVSVSTRGSDGELLPAEVVDRIVSEKVGSEIKSGRDVVLHVMHHSKTGARGPSERCLLRLQDEFPHNLQIVVDACQARASRGELRQLLGRNYILLITGSKFFCGPPLSGALILPAALADRIRHSPVTMDGLGDYSTRYDWPAGWGMREALPERINVGQFLRWTAALAEIERYFAVPLTFREKALQIFEESTRQAFARQQKLELLDPDPEEIGCTAAPRDEFRFRTVFSFTVGGRDGQMTEAEARLLHRALNADVTDIVSATVASQYCHIGQPVVIRSATKTVGALRISADARMVAECWFGASSADAIDRLRERCAKVETVFEKISFLTSHFDRLQWLPDGGRRLAP
jgi:selenocysteine lyase/cysteine desulfurase